MVVLLTSSGVSFSFVHIGQIEAVGDIINVISMQMPM